MAARGDSAGAQALRRELATVGFSDTAKAIYDANTALTAQIDLEKHRLDLLRQQQSGYLQKSNRVLYQFYQTSQCHPRQQFLSLIHLMYSHMNHYDIGQ
jgi:hypothetical protein